MLLNQMATATAFFYCTLMLCFGAAAVHLLAARVPSEDLPHTAADEKEGGGLLKGSSGSDDF